MLSLWVSVVSLSPCILTGKAPITGLQLLPKKKKNHSQFFLGTIIPWSVYVKIQPEPCWLWLLSGSCWTCAAVGDRRPWWPRDGWWWVCGWFQGGCSPVSLSCMTIRLSWGPLHIICDVKREKKKQLIGDSMTCLNVFSRICGWETIWSFACESLRTGTVQSLLYVMRPFTHAVIFKAVIPPQKCPFTWKTWRDFLSLSC